MATKTPKNPAMPLSKSSRQAFEKRYQEIFLNEATKGISDEALMKAVNEHDEKTSNQEDRTQSQGNQNQAGNGKTEEQLRQEAVKRYVDASGKQPEETLSTDEINAEALTFENRKEGEKQYFNLFGEKPLETMTNDQIFSAIDSKKGEIDSANMPKVEKFAEVDLKEGQVLAKHKTSGEEKVFQAQTLKYLQDWEEVPQVPKEARK